MPYPAHSHVHAFAPASTAGQGAHGSVNLVIDMVTGRLAAMKIVNKKKQRRRSALTAMGRRKSATLGTGMTPQQSGALTTMSTANSMHTGMLATVGSHGQGLDALPGGGADARLKEAAVRTDTAGSDIAMISAASPTAPAVTRRRNSVLGVAGSGGSMTAAELNNALDAELLNEIEIMRALGRHPHIVGLKEVVQVGRGGVPCICAPMCC